MTKTPKSSSGTKSASAASGSARPSKHSKSSKTPVTIDLEAESVTANESAKATPPNTAQSNNAARSVPKTAPRPRAAEVFANKAEAGANKAAKLDQKSATTSTSDKSTTSNPSGAASQNNASKGTKPVVQKPTSPLLAGCLGGVVALLLAGGAQYVGLLGSPGASTGNSISAQMLDSRSDELNNKISEIDEKLAVFENAMADGDSSSLSAQDVTNLVEARVNDLAAQIGTSQGETQNVSAALAPINQTLDDLTARLESLSNKVASEAANSGSEQTTSSTDDQSLAQLRDQIAKLDLQITTLGNDLSQKLAGKADGEEIAQIKSALGEVETNLSGTSSQLQEQAAQLQSVGEKITNAPSKEAAKAIAAAALKSAVDQGTPFADALATFNTITGNEVDLGALEPFAKTGLPPFNAISSQFLNGVGGKIRAVLIKPADDSFASRLLSGARSLVEVKPLGPVDSSAPDAAVSEIENSLASGQLAAALAAWNTLPKEAKEASKDWEQAASARLGADTLIADAIRKFLVSNSDS